MNFVIFSESCVSHSFHVPCSFWGVSSGGSNGVQILSISCSFWEILAKSYVGAPLPRELVPPPRGNPGSATGFCPVGICRKAPPPESEKQGVCILMECFLVHTFFFAFHANETIKIILENSHPASSNLVIMQWDSGTVGSNLYNKSLTFLLFMMRWFACFKTKQLARIQLIKIILWEKSVNCS